MVKWLRRLVTPTRRWLRVDPRQILVLQRLTLTALLVSLLVYLLKLGHVLEGFETRWLDVMAYVDRPTLKQPVTVVGISDADYYDPALFAGSSPLDPDALSRILDRIGEHRPRAVVVDVQLHPAPFEPVNRIQGRMRLYRSLRRLAEDQHIPVVIVRVPESEGDPHAVPDSLGAAWRALSSCPNLAWADPILWSHDGVVRSVSRWIESESGTHDYPSVLGAIIRALDLQSHHEPTWFLEEEHPHEPWSIRFTGRFLEDTTAVSPIRVNAGVLLETPLRPGQRALLTDRIVLLGGLYGEGRDTHLTPVGEMAGVFIWAEAIASWMRRDSLREPPEWITLVLECLVGVLTGLLLLRFGPGFGLLWSLFAILPLSILFSLFTFGDRVLFVNFLPSFIGVYIHYQVELHLIIRELRHHLRERTGQLHLLQNRLEQLEVERDG